MRGNSLVYEGGLGPRGATEVCPKCGGLKSLHGDQCRDCQRKEAAAERARKCEVERRRIRREREGRFEAALREGWTLEELYRYHDGSDDDPVPTWEEIRARRVKGMITRWWAKTGQ